MINFVSCPITVQKLFYSKIFFSASLFGLLVVASSCQPTGGVAMNMRNFISQTSPITAAVEEVERDPVQAANHAFAGTLGNYVRQNCVLCHENNQNPTFAQADSSAARLLLVEGRYINFSEPLLSRIATKGSDGHCPNCTVAPEKMADLVKDWWKTGECKITRNCDSDLKAPLMENPRNQTLAIVIPESVNETTPTLMRWPLDSLGFAGAHFEVYVKVDKSSAGAKGYSFLSPRISIPVGKSSIHVSELVFFLNERVTNNTYDEVDMIVSAPGSILSSSVLASSSGGKIDLLSIGFGKLKSASLQKCKNLSDFSAQVRPKMQTNCLGCHGRVNTVSKTWFDMTGTDSEVCDRALQRINFKDISTSPLVVYPYFGVYGGKHPGVQEVSNKFDFFRTPAIGTSGSWYEWMKAEAASR